MKRRLFLAVPLAGFCRAQFGPPTGPKFAAIERRLRSWARAHPRWMRLETIGKSVEGRPLLRAWLTDSETPDRDKERVLLTALHAGQEHSGATSALAVMEWLLAGSTEAREVLARQTIVCLPVVNPDLYERPNTMDGLMNALRRDPYTGWNVDGPLDPERCPEAVAVQQTIDLVQAEVHTDLHGNSLPFSGVYQLESSGRAYSNVSLRPYHHDVMRLMDAAAEEAGFPSDRAEEDAERIFGGSDLGMPPEKLWSGIRSGAVGGVQASKPRIYAAIYGYNRYHTMILASETAWEQSALVRQRRLLRIGNETWPGESSPGYPVRVITKLVTDAMIVAWGKNAEQRRRSRIELWNKQPQLVHGSNRPSAVGRLVYVCATSAAAAERWLARTSMAEFAAKLREHPRMHADRVAKLLAGFPQGEGQWGPTSNISLAGGGAKQSTPIENGFSMRLRLPFPKAHRLDVWMNGEKQKPIIWVARAFTYVQIDIPPEQSRSEDFFVVTCTYDPGETRTTGLKWD